MIYQKRYSLKKHNTFGLEVEAYEYYEYENEMELSELYALDVFRRPFLCVGEGSNLLFVHSSCSAIVLHSTISNINVIESDESSVLVEVGSGVVWDDFVKWTVENKLGGVENLSCIPGLVGASPVQNIGAYGVEAKDAIEKVRLYDTREDKVVIYSNAECNFRYRGSSIKDKNWLIVVQVYYRLRKKGNYTFSLAYGNLSEKMRDKEISLENVRDTVSEIRNNKLPLPSELGSAGSIFKNPVVGEKKYEMMKMAYPDMPYYELANNDYKIPAAWLISQSGMKSACVGGAEVYEKQPLIIVNRHNATGKDILALMQNIQEAVLKSFDIRLEPEVCVVL